MPGSAEPPPAGAKGAGVPRLHVLVGDGELAHHGVERARELLGLEGVRPAIHLRARVPARSLYRVAAELAAGSAAEPSADAVRRGWCVVNGRPDIALAAGADAVQLGRAALPVADVRALVAGTDLRLGVSVHGPEEAARAAREGSDFLVVGTMYPTPSHPGRPGGGPEAMARAVAAVSGAVLLAPPLLGVGGIDAGRVGELVAAGAHGVVVARAVWNAPDWRTAALELARALAESAPAGGVEAERSADGSRRT